MTLRSIPILLASLLVLTGCATQMKVAQLDPTTGTLKSEVGQVTQAKVLTAKSVSLARFGGSAFVTNGGDYAVDQLKATRLFPEVLNFDDLQKYIVANKLQDKVASIAEPIGLSRLAAHKPFLWISFKRVNKDNKPHLQLIATDPTNLEEVFVAEVYLDFVWGVNDQNSRYPLFNALIEWARKNP